MESYREWLKIDEKELQYHTSQYAEPKEYTRHLLKEYHDFFMTIPQGSNILDIGCGAGAVTTQFARSFPHLNFIGIDINEKYIAIANELKSSNTRFVCSYLEHFSCEEQITGVMCIQTLSWMPDYFTFINALKVLEPSWALVTALFYEGSVDAFIRIRDYGRSMEEVDFRETYYNIYSIPEFEKHLQQVQFGITTYKPFEIGIDIPRKEGETGMATYTRKTDDGMRLQVSGPILMSWYTLLLNKYIL